MDHLTKHQVERYRWASQLAFVAMGKRKVWGEDPRHLANDDPLAWWLLTEAIATGGPKIASKDRPRK